MLKIFHNPRCSKSRQALSILTDNNVDIKIIEYLKDSPTKDELKSILYKLNKKPLDIIRKGEAIYKDLFKGKEFTNEEWIDIMVQNPKLIERPIVFDENNAIIGRPPELVKQFINTNF